MTLARMATHTHAAIVIPVHNEERYLPACLDAACRAAAIATNLGLRTNVIVVLDRCSDNSAAIAAQFPIEALVAEAGSVGAARSLGGEHAMTLGATWLAFTDADTLVSEDWLGAQLSLGADAVCGTVAVSDWHLHDPLVRAAYEAHYRDVDGHRHVHGANLGISSKAYQACGGFEHVAVHEDVGIVERLLALGFKVAWSAGPRVSTSARTANRVEGGFGALIRRLAGIDAAKNGTGFPLRA